jgi:hypothetical protein
MAAAVTLLAAGGLVLTRAPQSGPTLLGTG